MIRQAAVAGRFYPGNAAELTKTIRELLGSPADPVRVLGAVIPHAGYMYSGHVAGAVYSKIEIPAKTIVLCPNHTGLGLPLSIMRSGSWDTPLGRLEIDEELSSRLMAACPLLMDDEMAHRFEHALEVQLPFMQYLRGSSVRFVPITLGTGRWEDLEMLGSAIAQVVRETDPSILIIASSDMNHYESDAITRVKDRKAIDQVLRRDPRGLYDVVRREAISMCGFGPATTMLVAANQLGASTSELVRYATSGDTSGDFSHVVGYAGIIVQ
jgi:AmmeMemoRadiSam system protein B